jgi:capsular exopolysaccharide synthesis family protein
MDSSRDTKLPDNDIRQKADGQDESPVREYATILFRGKWIILATLIIVMGVDALYTFTTEPVYEATSLVLINMKGREGALPIFDVTGTATTNRITNELEILKSNSTTMAVARALLSRRHFDDDSSTVLPILENRTGDGQSTMMAGEGEIAGRLVGAVQFTPIRESDIIRITARSVDPREAALIANVYTQVYTERNLTTSRLQTQALMTFLQSQLHSRRVTLDSAENDLQRYMRVSGVVSLDAEANKVVEQLSQLEAQRDGMEVERSARKKNLASYQEELARQEPNAAAVIGESDDNYIRLLQEELAKLEVQRDVMTAQNPDLVAGKLYSDRLGEINSQITSLKERLRERTGTFLKSLLPGGGDAKGGNAPFLAQMKQKLIEEQIELGGLDARVKALNSVIAQYEGRFNEIPRQSIELAKLQRARLSSEKLYLLLDEKYNEAAIKEKSEFGYLNVLDPATVSSTPVSPRALPNLLLGLLIGLGAGIGIVLVRASLDGHVRTPEDLKRLGFLPLSSVSLLNGELKAIERQLSASGESVSLDPHLVSHHRPLAPVAESYRHLRLSLQHSLPDAPPRVLVVTSANPKEGKTTTVANLAITFSQSEQRVLLVDADMRRPRIHTLFQLENSVGLTEFLLRKAYIDDVVRKEVLPGLDIVTRGAAVPQPSQLLGSDAMKEFLVMAKERYDIVLFDSAPLVAVTDAAMLGRWADGVILVASAGEAQGAALKSIAEFLSRIGVRLLGVVLTKFDIRKVYGGYSSSYHYGYYGYEYPDTPENEESNPGRSLMSRLHRKRKRRPVA